MTLSLALVPEGAIRILLEPSSNGSLATLTKAAATTHLAQATCLIVVYEATSLALGTYTLDAPLPAELTAAVHQALSERVDLRRWSRRPACGRRGAYARLGTDQPTWYPRTSSG